MFESITSPDILKIQLLNSEDEVILEEELLMLDLLKDEARGDKPDISYSQFLSNFSKVLSQHTGKEIGTTHAALITSTLIERATELKKNIEPSQTSVTPTDSSQEEAQPKES